MINSDVHYNNMKCAFKMGLGTKPLHRPDPDYIFMS